MTSTATHTDRFETMRHAMVASQLRTNAVNDARVVSAMARGRRASAFLCRRTRRGFGLSPIPRCRRSAMVERAHQCADRDRQAADRGDVARRRSRAALIGAAGGYTPAVLAELVADGGGGRGRDAELLAGIARTALAEAMPAVTLVEGPRSPRGGHAARRAPIRCSRRRRRGGAIARRAGLAGQGRRPRRRRPVRSWYHPAGLWPPQSRGGFALALPFADADCRCFCPGSSGR